MPIKRRRQSLLGQLLCWRLLFADIEAPSSALLTLKSTEDVVAGVLLDL